MSAPRRALPTDDEREAQRRRQQALLSMQSDAGPKTSDYVVGIVFLLLLVVALGVAAVGGFQQVAK